MAINFNKNPFFDDYNDEKNFHRILYRPSIAVQARELTQQQTILQNQIARFGNHIFKNGAMVIPGQITFDNKYHYVKINQTYDSEEVVLSDFVGNQIKGLTSGATAEVINAVDIEGDDPKTLYVKYTESGENGIQTFQDGEILQRTDNALFECQVQGSTELTSFSSVGIGSASSIEAGVYFVDGFFINVYKQTLILSKYSDSPSCKVGLRNYERTITPEDDSTLNDNAIGSYNYAAPGAYRYKIELLLEYIDVNSEIPEDFVELQRIENGTIINEIRTSEYSELEKTFARRTFDESGDYTVSPFNISIKEHLKDETIPRLSDGKYLATDTPSGDETKLAIGIEPGKAYVRGYERQKLATTWIPTNKARTTEVSNNAVINFNIGNYIYVKRCFMIPDWSTFETVYLWDPTVLPDDGNIPAGTHIGTARVRGIELIDSTGTFDQYVYKLFLFDINLDSGKMWSSVSWITDSSAGALFTCTPNVGGDYADVDNMIIHPTRKSSIFKLPHQYVKTLKPNGTNDTTYTVNRVYPSVPVSANAVEINVGSNATPNAFTGRNYIVMNLDATTSANSFINISDANVTINGSVVTITGLSGSNVRVSIPVIKEVATERSKTINQLVQTISSPNTVPGSFDVLSRADGYKLISVIDGGDSDRDITERYLFDNGQRDSFYDRARIQLKAGYSAPKGDLVVTFSYFSHTAGDFCSVDSYSVDSYSALDYYDIPAYYSEDGQYDLSDCIDFRPVINSTGDGFSGTGARECEMPVALSNIRMDYEHYLSRIDKLYIDYTGKFGIIEGNPAVYPAPPKSPSDGMVLYEIFMTAYTYSPKNAKPKFIDNKRYTMRDIGRLEKRISTLEYYTSLSLLEKETAQMQIKDVNGLDRFKNGFLVEPFKSHGIGDSLSADYRCSIDPRLEQMRPTFSTDSVNLEIDETASTEVQKTGPLVTLPYTSVPFISQPLASMTENVNPFAIRLFEGKVNFQPDSDNWYDTKKNGDLIVNDDAHFQALEFIATHGEGLNGISWNDWETTWSTSSTQSSTSRKLEIDRSRDHDTEKQVRAVITATAKTTTTTNQTRTGTKTTFSEETINKFLGDRTVGINYIPYMRSIPVMIKVEAMKPSTVVYPFFDDISVIPYCTPAIRLPITSKTGSFLTAIGKEEKITTPGGGSAIVVFESATELTIVNWNKVAFNEGQIITGTKSGATATISISASSKNTNAGDELKTDAHGRIALIFKIPNNNTLKFRTGERKFILNDQQNNVEANQTKAEGVFKSLGSMLQQEGTVLSTKTIRFNREPLNQQRTTTSTTSTTSTTFTEWYDPLAQTFLIQEEGGCFVTSCTLYFQKVDKTGLPITFQIREVVNGYPGQAIVPYSEVVLYPDEIEIDINFAKIGTTFEMQAPVFLQQGVEYCFVLLSDSFDYNVWIANMGQKDVEKKQMISKQPYNGVLFKSQNASTWTANQDQDMKFVLNKARFKIETAEGSGVPYFGHSFFNNQELITDILDINPVETFSGSTKVRIHQFAHGMVTGSKVTLSNFATETLINGVPTETFYNGIPGSELNGTFNVEKIEFDSYQIEVTTPATDTGVTGGSDIEATRNIQADIIRPNITELVLPGSSSLWGMKTTKMDYTIVPSASYSGISIDENNFMNESMRICSYDNESTHLSGAKSLQFLNIMNSTNRNISPVIDTNRCSIITVANRIDNHATKTNDFNCSTTINENLVNITHTGHGMATGATVYTEAASPVGGLTTDSLKGHFTITRIDDNTYSIEAPINATSSATGSLSVTWCSTQYKYVPENYSQGGTAMAKYQTKRVTVEEPAISAKIILTAMVMNGSSIELWYKKQGPYDTTRFADIEWSPLGTPDIFVPISENREDFKEYEFTKEFADGEEFTSFAVKIVSKSTNTTIVPIIDDLRIICLGT